MKMKVYIMPNGLKRQYEDGKAPEGAKPLKAEKKAAPEVEEKAVEEIKNKAVTPKNKSVRGTRK